jgi:hypothetical protein
MNKNEVVITLIGAGASGITTSIKNFLKTNDYLRNFKRKLKFFYRQKEDNEDSNENNEIITQNGSKKYGRSTDWLSIAQRLELTIEEILSLDMFDNEQQTTLMLFREQRVSYD